MDALQDELDATTAKIEGLRDRQDGVRARIADIHDRVADLTERRVKLRGVIVARADELYRSGGTSMVELLFSSEDFSELTTRAELLSRVSTADASAFVEYSRSTNELAALNDELATRQDELASTTDELAAASADLQDQFDSVASEYDDLQAKLAAASTPEPSGGGGGGGSPTVNVQVSGNMTCPVAGPVSFTDTWGAPRDGHTHQGVDMMANYGTPVVAITSGTITYAAYDGSGGNMIFLSGDDGNAYWYMHNQQNLVSGGHVSVGQQIATVGDTGNAAGTPHVHFEYHPGGGAAVDPYPLVASIC